MEAEFDNSPDAYAYLLQNKPNIVFLDIEMPFMNGFDLLEKLGKIEFKPIIISAYDQFGIKALKSNVFDYIVKPIDPLELKEVIERYMETNSLDNSLNIRRVLNRLIIPTGQDIRFISLARLVRCESDNNYTRITMEDGESIFISKTLKSIETLCGIIYRLLHKGTQRIHRVSQS